MITLPSQQIRRARGRGTPPLSQPHPTTASPRSLMVTKLGRGVGVPIDPHTTPLDPHVTTAVRATVTALQSRPIPSSPQDHPALQQQGQTLSLFLEKGRSGHPPEDLTPEILQPPRPTSKQGCNPASGERSPEETGHARRMVISSPQPPTPRVSTPLSSSYSTDCLTLESGSRFANPLHTPDPIRDSNPPPVPYVIPGTPVDSPQCSFSPCPSRHTPEDDSVIVPVQVSTPVNHRSTSEAPPSTAHTSGLLLDTQVPLTQRDSDNDKDNHKHNDNQVLNGSVQGLRFVPPPS